MCAGRSCETAAAPRAGFDLDAYVSYLTACNLYDRGGPTNNASAIALFGEAIRADPAFAPAWPKR
jgi:hypothetical protein